MIIYSVKNKVTIWTLITDSSRYCNASTPRIYTKVDFVVDAGKQPLNKLSPVEMNRFRYYQLNIFLLWCILCIYTPNQKILPTWLSHTDVSIANYAVCNVHCYIQWHQGTIQYIQQDSTDIYIFCFWLFVWKGNLFQYLNITEFWCHFHHILSSYHTL